MEVAQEEDVPKVSTSMAVALKVAIAVLLLYAVMRQSDTAIWHCTCICKIAELVRT